MKAVAVDESFVVCFYSFLVHAAVDALHFGFGIIAADLISRRGFNRESIAWVTIAMETGMLFFSAIPSRLYRLYGCRVPVVLGGVIVCSAHVVTALSNQSEAFVGIFIGLVSGLGMCLLYTSTWIAANTYYRNWRQLANGLVMSGSQIGLLGAAFFTHWLLEQYGLQGTFLILGGVTLNTVVLGALIPPLKTDGEKIALTSEPTYETKGGPLGAEKKQTSLPKQSESQTELGDLQHKSSELGTTTEPQHSETTLSEKMTNLWKYVCSAIIAVDLLKRWKYLLFVVYFFLRQATSSVYSYFPDFVIQSGYSKELSWQPIAIVAIADSVVRVTMGFSNKSPRVVLTLCAFAGLTKGLCCLLLPFIVEHYWLICCLGGAFGLARGIVISLCGPAISELVPEKDIDRGIGTCLTCTGLCPLLVYPVLGKLYDLTGTYKWTFLLSGGCGTLGAIIVMPAVIAL